MKTGRSLTDLAGELQRQAETKKDYLADSRALSLRVIQSTDAPTPGPTVILDGVNGGMTVRPIAHQQLAETLGIYKPYYDRMLSQAPELLARNVNHWFKANPAKRLVRTLDGGVRAILSDSYRPLDNFDLAEAILPKLVALSATVVSCEVTDSRFYLKAVTDKVQGEVKKGDAIQAGIVVSNSEVGQGALRIEELDYRLVCLNGMIRGASVRKAHLGRGARGQDLIEDSREYFRDETRQADDRAFFLKVQDAAASMFDPERFNRRLLQYQEASQVVIEADPTKVVELVGERYKLDVAERSSVMRHLIQGGDLSAWGLANAITRTAEDAKDYDRATEIERAGGMVVEAPSDWK